MLVACRFKLCSQELELLTQEITGTPRPLLLVSLECGEKEAGSFK